MQFGPSEDLESYPRDMDRDATLCEKAGMTSNAILNRQTEPQREQLLRDAKTLAFFVKRLTEIGRASCRERV